jgi:hypothetical protein
MERLQKYLTHCYTTTIKLRSSLYFDLEKSFYFENQFADIPIISDEQISALQSLRDSTQEAILDVVKSGKTEKIKLIDNKNDQWNGEVDTEVSYSRFILERPVKGTQHSISSSSIWIWNVLHLSKKFA